MKKYIALLGFLLLLLICSGCIQEQTTPHIQFQKDGKWLRVLSVDREADWSDMNITLSAGNYSFIAMCPAPIMSMTYSYGTGASCPDTWKMITPGNALHFLCFNENITVHLRWLPTNTIIGEWTFP